MARAQNPDSGNPVGDRRGTELTPAERDALAAVERAKAEAAAAEAERRAAEEDS